MVFVRYKDFEQMCRVGCPDEPDSLSHYNECPLTQFFLSQSVGVIDPFVHAHNNHRRNMDNVGTYGDW